MCALAVGIDLGTTNSCISVYKEEKVEVIQNEEGSYVIPSCVSFTDDGILTGHDAVNECHKYTRNTLFEVKRLIGQKYDDQDVQKDIQRFPYKVINDNGIIKIKVDYRKSTAVFFPEEISAFVLKKLKTLAECHLGQDITKVVVTVPAYFNDFQRQATKDAATIAGFKTVNIINEPTAAALAFNYQNPKRYKRNVMVYDFGGGTFDVSIVNIGQGNCEVKATKGDLHLGGTDIDSNLVSFIKEDFLLQFGEQLLETEAEMRRLRNSCEKIKKRLSGAQRSVEIELCNLSGKDYISSISKEKFEAINQEIFQRTLEIVENCLESSGLTKEEIDEVVLVGGSSRIPKVQEMLKDYFGEDKLNKGVNPDEAVAYGAAIHATNLVGNKYEVQDVVSHSLGIAEMSYLSSVIIPSNTSVPAKITKCYRTVGNNQEKASIVVYQGEKPLIDDNFELGRFILTRLRKAPKGMVKINVCFEIDGEGILNVTASEVDAENERGIEIDVKRKGLSAEEIEHRTAEVEEHGSNELKRKEFLIEKHNLEKFCVTIASTANDATESQTKYLILNKCNEICDWLNNISINSQGELEEKRKELDNLFSSFI